MLNLLFKTKNVLFRRPQRNPPWTPVEDIKKWDTLQATDNLALGSLVNNEQAYRQVTYFYVAYVFNKVCEKT